MGKDNPETYEKEFKSKLLGVLQYTIDFLDKHNLRWFVGQGSCIGAVRHHGLIPWDDDIDLLMPRDDYDKLISLHEEMKGTGYELVSWKTHETMIPFVKIVDRNTTIWEVKYHPYISGVFVDVFPMELSSKTKDEIIKDLKCYDNTLRKYRSSMTSYSWKDIFELGINCRFYFFCEGVMSKFTRRHTNRYLQRLQAIEKENNSGDGNFYVLFSASFVYAYEREVFKKEWFCDFVTMPFEDMEVRVPIGYDAYLKHVYGNYMNLPPVEKRVSRHFHYYVNLQEGKTIEEVREIKLKKNETELLLP